MNTTFKARVLQHLNQKREQRGEKGFTLIELLVVIIIIGILAAIALPSFLNQANKGKQAEAKQYVSSVNKGQQAFYTENGSFVDKSDASGWNSLGVGIKTQTANYKYTVQADATKADALANPLDDKIKKALRAYTGGVRLVGSADKTTTSIVCETKTADKAAEPTGGNNDQIECAGEMQAIKQEMYPILAQNGSGLYQLKFLRNWVVYHILPNCFFRSNILRVCYYLVVLARF